jgi:hypothetical protein
MAKNTIKVKKYADVIEEYTSTAVAITPGTFLELTSDGLVQACTATTGPVLPMVALEDELQGKGIDDAIPASNKVQCWIPGRGDMVYALLEDGQTIAIGDFLELNGSGLVQKYTSNQIIGVAVEAVDDSGSSGADTGRIIMRIY